MTLLSLKIPPHLMCCYTTLWNIRHRTRASDDTDLLRDQRWSSPTCGPQISCTYWRTGAITETGCFLMLISYNALLQI